MAALKHAGLWIVSAFTGNLADARHRAALILLAAGVLAPALARLSFYTATRRTLAGALLAVAGVILVVRG